MDTTLLLSTEYANARRQFGRAIGSFQAVQHMVVKIASETAAVSIAVEHAVSILSTNPLWGAALAKGRASEAAGHVSAAAHQLHGAIGYTHEYALQQFTRNLLAWREEYGNEYAWYNRVGGAHVSSDKPLWARICASGL
jgi:acyl-CoA dehydrogenase